MARQQGRQLTPRTQMDPRETFDYTTPDIQVRATPVSSYRQTDVSSGYGSLIKALSGVNSSLQAFMGASVADKQADYVEGQESFKKGQELAPGSPEAMIIGYERLRGQSSAKQYEKDLSTNLKANARYMTQQDFDEFMNATAGKYTQGATEHFLAGFFDGGALEMETNANAYYKEVRQDQMRVEAVDMAATTAGELVESFLEDDLGLDFVEKLDDPLLYDSLSKTKNDITGKTFFQNASETIRAKLTEAQEAAKLLGIPAKEVTAAFIDVIGTQASYCGMPELLDFTKLKDKSGISIIDTDMRKKLESYRSTAKHNRNVMYDQFEKRKKEAKKLEMDMLVNEVSKELSEISSLVNPKEIGLKADELRKKLETNEDFKSLPTTQYQAIYNTLADFDYLSQQAPRISDISITQDLETKFLFDKLTAEEVNNAFTRQLLSKSDYSKLMGGVYTLQQNRIAMEHWNWDKNWKIDRAKISDARYAWARADAVRKEAKADAEKERQRREQAARDKENSKRSFPEKEACLDLHDDIRKYLGVTSGYVDMDTANLSTRMLNSKLQKFRSENGGRGPSFDEYVTNVAEPVLKHFKTDMEKMMKGIDPPPKSKAPEKKKEEPGWLEKFWGVMFPIAEKD